MCVYYVPWIDSANKGLHMVTYLYLLSATALKGSGLMRASSKFILTRALPLCAVMIILAKEEAAPVLESLETLLPFLIQPL